MMTKGYAYLEIRLLKHKDLRMRKGSEAFKTIGFTGRKPSQA